MKRTYNNFSALENEIECSICNNFGHEDSECRSRSRQTTQKEQASLTPKTWRKKEPQLERCGIALYVEGQDNQWYINSGCSKHMTGDKEKLHSYSALEKEKKVSFGNDNPTFIKGKGSVRLKEKVKDGNVMYVDGLKHNLLSVSQMCDQGTKAVCDLPDIRIPDNTICKSCKFGLMKYKDEAFEKFKSFKALVENESNHRIKCLRSDRGGEFTSDEFFDFCEEHGIRREFSTTRTPQQNGVVERMNRTIQQMARAMLDETGTPATFWGEVAFAVVTILHKTNVRFEPRADEGILLGYSPHNKAYKCYNKRLGKIVESIDVVVSEEGNTPRQVKSEDFEDGKDYPSTSNHIHDEEETHEAPEEQIRIEEKTPSRYVKNNHPESQILGQKEAGVQIRRTILEASIYLALLSSTEP
eukprot:PITA_09419